MSEYDILRTKNKDKLLKLNLPDIELPPLKVLIWDVGYPADIEGLVKFIPVFERETARTAHGTNVAQVLQTIYSGPIEFYLSVTSNKLPEAIDFCIANNIRLINASLRTLETVGKTEAIKKYAEWGGILVAAAGNDGGDPVEYPANLPYTIAVSATNTEDCNGPEIDITADSMWWIKYAAGFYDSFNGTSCATPVISACVGIILAVYPEWRLEEVKSFLQQNSIPGNEPYERIFRFPDNFGKEVAMESIWNPSPNYREGRGGKTLIAIVNHITAGLMPGTLSWLKNPASQASAHYLVTKDGRIYQLVADEDTAWHSGIVNRPNWPLYDGTNPNSYTLGIEHEALAGEALTEAQYQATLSLHRQLVNKWGIPVGQDHIIGHNRIDSVNRSNDPGPNFPWERLFADLKGVVEVAEEVVVNTPSNWAKEAWEWGIAQGITDGTNPQEAITREQVITMLYRYDKLKEV
jgi:N-acetylmuramoyl-L-alanine amidase